jgi:hypothetical protein
VRYIITAKMLILMFYIKEHGSKEKNKRKDVINNKVSSCLD